MSNANPNTYWNRPAGTTPTGNEIVSPCLQNDSDVSLTIDQINYPEQQRATAVEQTLITAITTEQTRAMSAEAGVLSTANAALAVANTAQSLANTSEQKSNKNQPGGYSPLDTSGLVPIANTNLQAISTYVNQYLPSFYVPGTSVAWNTINDGNSHPLSTITDLGFTNTTGWTLAQWQAVLPAAISLSDELGWAALQSSINYVGGLTYGGEIRIPGGIILVNRQILQPFQNVSLRGAGRGNVHDTETGGPIPCTLIRYNGAAGLTSVLLVSPNTNTSSGHVNTDCDTKGFMVDGQYLSNHAIVFQSIEGSTISVNGINTTDFAIVFDTAALAEHNDVQHNNIICGFSNINSTGGGVLFQATSEAVGSATAGNFSMNNIQDIYGLVNGGLGFSAQGTDNNNWNRISVYQLQSGAAGADFNSAQSERITYFGCNAPWTVRDTNTQLPLSCVYILSLDTSNGTPAPTVTSPAFCVYNDNLNGLTFGLAAASAQFYATYADIAAFIASGGVDPTCSQQIISGNSNHLQLLSSDNTKRASINIDSNGNPRIYSTTGGTLQLNNGGPVSMGGKVGFFGTTPSVQPTVSGSKGGNAALGSLISALSQLGLIIDTTTT